MKKNCGFTLPELIVTFAIGATLLSITTVTLFTSKGKASLSTSVATLVSDLYQQQQKAMTGDTEGRSTSDAYGIYFDQDSYTLFHGSMFSQGAADNFNISAGDNIVFTNMALPQSQIVFASGSGEFANYQQGANSLTVQDATTGEEKTITINRFGVVEQIQ